MRATVIATTDANQAQRFVDEHGGQWVYYTDDCHLIAVNACDDMGNLIGGAGVFRWDAGSETTGEIMPSADGETFDVNYPGEFAAKGGSWCLAEEVAA